MVLSPCWPALAAQPPLGDEIQAYVGIAAMAQTASDRCPDILVKNSTIRTAPGYFHITAEDEPATRLAYGIEMKRLAEAIEAASSLKAWCDAAYRAHGPDGDVMKGLFGK